MCAGWVLGRCAGWVVEVRGGWWKCGVGGGSAGWVVQGGGVGWGGWWRCGRGEAIAPLEFPKLANAQPSNFEIYFF